MKALRIRHLAHAVAVALHAAGAGAGTLLAPARAGLPGGHAALLLGGGAPGPGRPNISLIPSEGEAPSHRASPLPGGASRPPRRRTVTAPLLRGRAQRAARLAQPGDGLEAGEAEAGEDAEAVAGGLSAKVGHTVEAGGAAVAEAPPVRHGDGPGTAAAAKVAQVRDVAEAVATGKAPPVRLGNATRAAVAEAEPARRGGGAGTATAARVAQVRDAPEAAVEGAPPVRPGSATKAAVAEALPARPGGGPGKLTAAKVPEAQGAAGSTVTGQAPGSTTEAAVVEAPPTRVDSGTATAAKVSQARKADEAAVIGKAPAAPVGNASEAAEAPPARLVGRPGTATAAKVTQARDTAGAALRAAGAPDAAVGKTLPASLGEGTAAAAKAGHAGHAGRKAESPPGRQAVRREAVVPRVRVEGVGRGGRGGVPPMRTQAAHASKASTGAGAAGAWNGTVARPLAAGSRNGSQEAAAHAGNASAAAGTAGASNGTVARPLAAESRNRSQEAAVRGRAEVAAKSGSPERPAATAAARTDPRDGHGGRVGGLGEDEAAQPEVVAGGAGAADVTAARTRPVERSGPARGNGTAAVHAAAGAGEGADTQKAVAGGGRVEEPERGGGRVAEGTAEEAVRVGEPAEAGANQTARRAVATPGKQDRGDASGAAEPAAGQVTKTAAGAAAGGLPGAAERRQAEGLVPGKLAQPSSREVGPGITHSELLCRLKQSVRFQGALVLGETRGRLRRNYRTCSVVSSSGVLKRHKHGAAIDAADMVMRFNVAPTGKFADIVGSREDIRVVNQQFPAMVLERRRLGSFQLRDETSVVVVPMVKPPRLVDLHRAHPRMELYELWPEMHQSVTKALQSIYSPTWFHTGSYKGVSLIPSSGAVGMVLALSLCSEVRAYGFAATAHSRQYDYNYFDDYHVGGNASDNNWHSTFDAEKDLWRRLAANTAKDVDASDVAVIPGLRSVACKGDRYLRPRFYRYDQRLANRTHI